MNKFRPYAPIRITEEDDVWRVTRSKATSATFLTSATRYEMNDFKWKTVFFFHAREPTRVGPGGGDASEQITTHEVPLPGLRRFLADRAAAGLAVDPKIYAGLFLVGAQVPS